MSDSQNGTNAPAPGSEYVSEGAPAGNGGGAWQQGGNSYVPPHMRNADGSVMAGYEPPQAQPDSRFAKETLWTTVRRTSENVVIAVRKSQSYAGQPVMNVEQGGGGWGAPPQQGGGWQQGGGGGFQNRGRAGFDNGGGAQGGGWGGPPR